MTKDALKLWMGLPADIRRMLLSNVWCVECRKAMTIVLGSTIIFKDITILKKRMSFLWISGKVLTSHGLKESRK